jgi:hypothetical protein
MKILSVGDRVEAGPYRLHSRFRRVANYLLEAGRPRPELRHEGPPSPGFGEASAAPPTADMAARPAPLLCLVARSVGPGPIHIVVGGEIPEADSLTVEPGALRIGTARHALDDCPRYDSALPAGPLKPARLADLASHVRARAHPKSLAFLLDKARTAGFRGGFEQNLVRQVREGAGLLFGDEPARGARLLRGCGFGLTPSGDDFLAGVLIGLNLALVGRGRPDATAHLGGSSGPALPPDHYQTAGRARAPARAEKATLLDKILSAARGENVLSNAFLDLAADGRVNEAMKQLITALTGNAAKNVGEAADRVLAQGETSGADVLTGLVLAMHKGCPTLNNQPAFARATAGKLPTCNGIRWEARHDGPR